MFVVDGAAYRLVGTRRSRLIISAQPSEMENLACSVGENPVPGLDMDNKLKLYAEAMAADPVPLKDLNARFVELDDIMLCSEHHCS
jgi:hypothetical protein